MGKLSTPDWILKGKSKPDKKKEKVKTFKIRKCPKCGSTSVTESWKGKIEIVDPATSEIAKELKLAEKGVYTIKSD